MRKCWIKRKMQQKIEYYKNLSNKAIGCTNNGGKFIQIWMSLAGVLAGKDSYST